MSSKNLVLLSAFFFSHTQLSALSSETKLSRTTYTHATQPPHVYGTASWRDDKRDIAITWSISCLLYTSDAADERINV